jgi:hypothetical protein
LLIALKNDIYIFAKGIVDRYAARYDGNLCPWGVIKQAFIIQYQSKNPREVVVKKLLNLTWTEGRLADHINRFTHLLNILEKHDPMAEPNYIRIFIRSLRNHPDVQKKLELTPMYEQWKTLGALLDTAHNLGTKEIEKKHGGEPPAKKQKLEHSWQKDNKDRPQVETTWWIPGSWFSWSW